LSDEIWIVAGLRPACSQCQHDVGGLLNGLSDALCFLAAAPLFLLALTPQYRLGFGQYLLKTALFGWGHRTDAVAGGSK